MSPGHSSFQPGYLKSLYAVAFPCSNQVPLDIAQILIGMIGMAVPVALGTAFENIALGVLASYGAMVVSGTPPAGTMRRQLTNLTHLMLLGSVAVFLGKLIGGCGWITGWQIIIISFLTALFGGISRPAAQASTRLLILVIIGTGIGESGPPLHPFVLTMIFTVGSLWGIFVSLSILSLFSTVERHSDSIPLVTLPLQEQIKRWKSSLAYFSGWQYTVRITLSMVAAEAIVVFLNQQKPYWVFLTIALVLQRSFTTAFSRIFQRSVGTFIGVLLGSILIYRTLAPWSIVLIIGILAALRQFYKDRNYAIYTAIMTPLIMIIISLGQPVTLSLLLERLLDTFAGCIIAFFLGYCVWSDQNVPPRDTSNNSLCKNG